MYPKPAFHEPFFANHLLSQSLCDMKRQVLAQVHLLKLNLKISRLKILLSMEF